MHAAPAFAACDLGIGLAHGLTGHFPARADLLAADLAGVASVLEAGGRRDAAVRDAVLLSVAANLLGVFLGLRDRGHLGVKQASLATYAGALATLAGGWLRLQGGKRPGTSSGYLLDPRPERWGRQEAA